METDVNQRLYLMRRRINDKKLHSIIQWNEIIYYLKLQMKFNSINNFTKLKRIPLIGIFVLALNACTQLTNPIPFGLYRGLEGQAPSGTVPFKLGWKDGCESGMAAYGTLHYKATHDYKYDVKQLDNNEYHGAWKLGFRHCRWYAAEWNR